jgi:hypothetical protein
MPQFVRGEGCVPLKPGVRAEVAELAAGFDGFLVWDQFDLKDDRLSYAYDTEVGIDTAVDLSDFLDELAATCACAGWAHYGEGDTVIYYGPTDRDRLEAEVAELERKLLETSEALLRAYPRLAAATA